MILKIVYMIEIVMKTLKQMSQKSTLMLTKKKIQRKNLKMSIFKEKIIIKLNKTEDSKDNNNQTKDLLLLDKRLLKDSNKIENKEH